LEMATGRTTCAFLPIHLVWLLTIASTLLILTTPTLGALTLSAVTSNCQSNCLLFNKVELFFNVSGQAYSNPYDPSQVNVTAQFTNSASGSSPITVYCFAYQNYTRSGSVTSAIWTTNGPLGWGCRFTPTATGSFSYLITVQDTANPSGVTSTGSFTVVSSNSPGFVQLSTTNSRYFVRSHNGEAYFPLGEDMGWGRNSFDYDVWLPKLAAAGGTWIRVWMSDFYQGFTIEWSNTGLGNYGARQISAWELDYVFSLCEQYGITIQLCLNHHGQFSTTTDSEWSSNPYNSANGGPLSSPDLVWTDPTAASYFERRYRYIVARWGYSTALHAWELWNEMNWIDNFAKDVTQATTWHAHFYSVLQKYDPYRHLITTSFAVLDSSLITTIFQEMDYTQIHYYGASDMAVMASGTLSTMFQSFPTKPCYFGEFGTGSSLPNQSDPVGWNIHNEQWSSLMSGAAGGGFTWYWDSYVDPYNLYSVFTGISAFVAGEDLDLQNYAIHTPQVSSTSVALPLYISPSIGWGTIAPYNTFTIDQWGTVTPSPSYLSTYLYGPYHTNLQNPPSFILESPPTSAFTFQISVILVASSGSTISVLANGNSVLNQALSGNSGPFTLTANIPAGTRNISVAAIATDWIQVGAFIINGLQIQPLRSYVMVGNSKILGWVQSQTHTWYELSISAPQANVNGGTITLNCTQSATVEIWNTVQGTVVSTTPVTCDNNQLTVNVPSIDSNNADWAFKVSYTSSSASRLGGTFFGSLFLLALTSIFAVASL